ncbi:S9 family peptidase [Lapillicoccus sp.]|uniref:S9 family peptidase n=1 Tax=Lapillicoccus sp. TaxID=1909287 RepID=UPI00326565CE
MTSVPEPDVSDLVERLLDIRTWVAFDVDDEGRVLAGSDDLGSVQLVQITPDGRRTALTALPSKCSGRYAPGRRAVVVQHDTGGDENMQLSWLALEGLDHPATLADLTPLVADPAHMHVLEDVTATSVIYSTNRRNDVDMDVVVRDLDSGAERVVFDAGGYVVGSVVSHDEQSVAVLTLNLQPNGTAVAVVRSAAADSDQQTTGPFTRSITDPQDHAAHENLSWSAPDGAIVMTSNHDREFAAIVSAPVDGSPWHTLVEDDAHDLVLWASPDGASLVVGTVEDGAVLLAVHDGDGQHRCDVDLPAGVPTVVWAEEGNRFVVSLATPTDPGSLHLADAHTGSVTQLVDAREGIPEQVRDLLVTPTVHQVPTPDGEQVPCFVYAGSDADPHTVGASVVHVHGGPESAAWRTFVPVIQALALSGFTVLAPNVRGSVGYGKRWYSLDDVDLRLDSVADLAALHEWLPTQGLDPARAALWGGSYGGYMVLAGVSMQPELWAAGVDIVGISSLVTFLENTSGYRRAYREREYGSLQHDRELLERASPITYLGQMRAPLFVIHGANDPRVPLSEAEQMAAALTAKGVPCELRVYGDEGHGLAKRENRLDAYPAAIHFLRRHLAAD